MYMYLFGNEKLPMWTIMVGVGILAALLIYRFFSTPFRLSDKSFLRHGLIVIGSVVAGFLFAYIFQGIYNVIAGKPFGNGVTFMGGLVGGVATFLIAALIFCRGNVRKQLWNTISLAPIAITAAHGFGRIGCYCGGCCYGIHSNIFPHADFFGDGQRLATQLIEAAFLFLLCAVLILLVLKFKKYSLTMIIYLFSYSIFRFFLEFVRGDEARGVIYPLSPSQWQCVIMLLCGVALTVYIFGFKRIPLNGKQHGKLSGFLCPPEKLSKPQQDLPPQAIS